MPLNTAQEHMLREAREAARSHLETLRAFVHDVVRTIRGSRASGGPVNPHRDEARRSTAHSVRMALHHAERGNHAEAARHLGEAESHARRGGFTHAADQAGAMSRAIHADGERERAARSRERKPRAPKAAGRPAGASKEPHAVQRGRKGGQFYYSARGVKIYLDERGNIARR